MIRHADGRRCEMSETLNNGAPKLLLTPKQAAAALSISERKLWELSRLGTIKRLKIGASVRYALHDLEEWINHERLKAAYARCQQR
jgi:excisionase family DNA binding protein